MSDWTTSQTCPGYREKTIQHGHATIIIRRPILDEVERVKRERRAKDTLGRVLNEHIHRKESNQ